VALHEPDEETRARRKLGARAFLKTAAQAGVGIWIGRVQAWCDEHGATFTMHREHAQWKITVQIGPRIVTADGASIAEALARVGMTLFTTK